MMKEVGERRVPLHDALHQSLYKYEASVLGVCVRCSTCVESYTKEMAREDADPFGLPDLRGRSQRLALAALHLCRVMVQSLDTLGSCSAVTSTVLSETFTRFVTIERDLLLMTKNARLKQSKVTGHDDVPKFAVRFGNEITETTRKLCDMLSRF